MELTTLIIPGENDSEEQLQQLAEFIVNETGPDTPWHISRFYPQHKMEDVQPTSAEILDTAMQIGKAAGLRYIYVGNLSASNAESTHCYNCNQLLIQRQGYTIIANNIKNNACPNCSTKIAGIDL